MPQISLQEELDLLFEDLIECINDFVIDLLVARVILEEGEMPDFLLPPPPPLPFDPMRTFGKYE